MKQKIFAVDLFCGVGGLTHGIIQSGINVIAGIDIDETCKYAFENNNKSIFLNKDIKKIDTNEIIDLYPKDGVKVLVGCAPCQPFSKYSNNKNNKKKYEKYDLLNSFSKVIMHIKPDIISMENVPQIENQKIFKDFLRTLKKLNYYTTYSIVYCPDYGIPQNRSRLVLLASKYKTIKLLQATHLKNNYVTVRDTIGHLSKLSAGEIDKNDLLHRSSVLNNINLKRIRQSKPGGTWLDWDKELLAECHKKESGKSFSSVYSRMEWDKVSPTITTQFYSYGTGRFGHPEQDRALTLREGALLQTFPIDYDFIDPNGYFSIKAIGRQIGNAVPVKLGKVIGDSIIEHLNEI